MSEITVSPIHVAGDVGVLRVAFTTGDKLIEYSPAFSLVGLEDPFVARSTLSEIFRSTSEAFLKAGVTIDDVVQIIRKCLDTMTVETLKTLKAAS